MQSESVHLHDGGIKEEMYQRTAARMQEIII